MQHMMELSKRKSVTKSGKPTWLTNNM